MKKNYRTVIFDLDGTLLNTLEDLCDSVNEIMRRYGWEEHTLREVRGFVGNGIGKLMERSVPDGKKNPEFESAVRDFKQYYTGHCQIKTKPYDGVVEMMEELKGMGIRMAIVSNKNDAAVKNLNRIYFSDYVRAAIGDCPGRLRKPAPDAVFAALEQLGAEKEHTVYIGDSDVDYETAKNSGVDCVLVSWGFRDRELLQSLRPAAIVDSCDEIIRFIKKHS